MTTSQKERSALITSGEVASYLGLNVKTVRQLVADGVLTPVAIPGLTWMRFRRADVERLVNGEERPRE
jgi:excisionase family DNA binding protein